MYCAASVDGERVVGILIYVWPDDERFDIRYGGISHTISLEDLLGIYNSQREAIMSNEDQALKQIRQAVLDFRATRQGITREPEKRVNRYASILQGSSLPPLEEEDTDVAGNTPPPSSSAASPSPQGSGSLGGGSLSPRRVQRLSNGKYEIFFALDASVKVTQLRDGILDVVESDRQLGRLYRIVGTSTS